MKNHDALIKSGKLEAYVLGILSSQENEQIEQAALESPQVREALQELDLSLMAMIQAGEIAPPVHVKAALDKKLFPATSASAPKNAHENVKHKPRIQPFYFWAAAASWILLGVMGGVLLFQANGLTRIKEMLEDTRLQLAQEQERSALLAQKTLTLESSLNYVAHPASYKVVMKGLPNKDSSCCALVFWNPETSTVELKIHHLPPPPNGKSWQLWAISNGEPVNLGLIVSRDLQKMGAVKNAETFAVSLENEGGSLSPTPDEVYLVGNI